VTLSTQAQDIPRHRHFLAASRLGPYKNIQAVIPAFRVLPELELIVAGDGPEAKRLRAIAGPNVSFVGFVSDPQLRHLMATARALIFAAEEDFGIVPVEAQSEGTPVLALGRGGVLETVAASSVKRTGMFFAHPDPREIAECVRAFVTQEHTFSRSICREQASRFSAERFKAELRAFIDRELENDRRSRAAGIMHLVQSRTSA
jgi:glycosyltransferase involved in cell wall biosynthesis